MPPIHACQIKAARAMLDWSQEDLAIATGLSITTIRNLEAGGLSPRGTTNGLVRRAIENAGLEFIAPEGIRRRLEEITMFQGHGCQEQFFDDVISTVKTNSGNLLASNKTINAILEIWGHNDRINRKKWEQISEITSIQCLLTDTTVITQSLPFLACRHLNHAQVISVPCFIYGNKLALHLPDMTTNGRFVVFSSVGLLQSCRHQFLDLWDAAYPLHCADEHKLRLSYNR